MCRWAAYTVAPIFLEEIVSRPEYSLIHQSHCATRCHTAINADGFDFAWYGARPEPGLFRDVLPAWLDPNQKSPTVQVQSHLFLAHIRQGRAVVSEPLEAGEIGWEGHPPYSFCTFNGPDVRGEEFRPCGLGAAA